MQIFLAVIMMFIKVGDCFFFAIEEQMDELI